MIFGVVLSLHLSESYLVVVVVVVAFIYRKLLNRHKKVYFKSTYWGGGGGGGVAMPCGGRGERRKYKHFAVWTKSTDINTKDCQGLSLENKDDM